MLGEGYRGRSRAQNHEFRWSSAERNTVIQAILRPPGCVAFQGWLIRQGAPPCPAPRCWGGPNRRREDLIGARVLARMSQRAEEGRGGVLGFFNGGAEDLIGLRGRQHESLCGQRWCGRHRAVSVDPEVEDDGLLGGSRLSDLPKGYLA
jgi:hypothetical protein